MKQIIQQGAEAVIYKIGNKIVKERLPKHYRLLELDNKIRRSRTKSEAKIMNKLKEVIPVPKILKTDANEKHLQTEDKGYINAFHLEKQEIIMEYINGEKLSDALELLDYKSISKIIGETIAKFHNQNIIHGDLTTSNMIYVENNKNHNSITYNHHPSNKVININDKIAKQLSKKKLLSINNQINENESANSENKVYFIDFGLSFHSNKIEDKAVDLHLLKQALEAKHFTIFEECLNIILSNYEKTANQGKEILHRIKVIESRGRYKDKY